MKIGMLYIECRVLDLPLWLEYIIIIVINGVRERARFVFVVFDSINAIHETDYNYRANDGVCVEREETFTHAVPERKRQYRRHVSFNSIQLSEVLEYFGYTQ